MTYLDRPAYSVLPPPAANPAHRPGRRRIGLDIRDAFDTFGPSAVEAVLREHVRTFVVGRASCPAEVSALREWIAFEVEECSAYWLDRLARPGVEPEEETEQESERARERRLATAEARTCTSCGASFLWRSGARGRPRTRCDACRRA